MLMSCSLKWTGLNLKNPILLMLHKKNGLSHFSRKYTHSPSDHNNSWCGRTYR